MLIIDKLKHTEAFSDSEKKIAEYVLINLKNIRNYTIYELAAASFTSVSTVSRFCKKIGSSSFKDFQLSLSSEINNFDHFTGRIEYDFPIQNEQATLDVVKKVQQLHLQTLNDTINKLDIGTLEKIVDLLLKAPAIEIFAEANSFSVASNLYNKLVWLEISANIDNVPGNQFLKAKTLQKNTVVFMISYYGKSATLNRIADYLIENDMKFILLTGPEKNILQKKAYYHLAVPPSEDKYKKVASIGSDVALHTIIDCLIMLLHTKKAKN